MKSLSNPTLIGTSIAFITVIGAAIYEHLAVVPQWSAAPPLSLAMFQGEYGLNPGRFWMPIHPITLLLFILSLSVSWKTKRRNLILASLLVYAAILVITAFYFVPELISITQTPFTDSISNELVNRSVRWETLSLVRLSVLVLNAVMLLVALTRSVENNALPQNVLA